MQTPNVKNDFRSDAPVWVLLAELSLQGFLSDPDRRDVPTAGSLFQMLQKLGMSPYGMENIAGTVARFAKEAFARTKRGRLEFPGRIRIFCQKKIIEDENSAKSSQQPEQDKQQKRIFPDSGASEIGGWGYFMIERGEDPAPDSSAILQSYIDLYLYKEGE